TPQDTPRSLVLQDGAGSINPPAPNSSAPDCTSVSNSSDEGLTVNDKPKIRLSEDAVPGVTTPAAATTSSQTTPANSLPPAVALAGNAPVVVPSRSQLRTEMIASFASVLFMEPAEVDDSRLVGELGMDSVLAVDWVRELNQRYGLSLEA